MFSFTGLSVSQSKIMVDLHHVYMTPNGRISISGLNTNNVEYVAKAFKDVVVNHGDAPTLWRGNSRKKYPN